MVLSYVLIIVFIYCLYLAASELIKIKDKITTMIYEIDGLKKALDYSSLVSIADKEGKIKYANEMFCKISGYTKKELIGKDHRIVNSGYHPKEVMQIMWEEISNGRVWKGILRNKGKRGNYYWVNTTIIPMLDKDRKIDYYISIRHDITSIYVYNSLLQEEKERLDFAQEAARIGFWDWNIEAKVFYRSNQLYKIFGIGFAEDITSAPEQFIKASDPREYFMENCYSEDKAAIYSALTSIFDQKRTSYRFEHRALKSQKNVIWVLEMGKISYGTNGDIVRISGIIQEITAEKLTQKLIEEQNKRIEASEKLATLGAISGGIAHEVKNPMAIIRGLSDITLKQVDNLDKIDDTKENLRQIVSAVDRVISIVKTLSRFSRKSEEDSFQECSVSEVIGDATLMLKEQLKAHDINLLYNSKNEKFYGRASEIVQVLLNVLGNSIDALIDFKEKDKKIEIIVSENISKKVLEIIVQDNGPGISKVIQEKIMEPFFTTKPVGKGTGLGLSISQKIANDHKGKLEIVPSEVGARFKLSLPLEKPADINV